MCIIKVKFGGVLRFEEIGNHKHDHPDVEIINVTEGIGGKRL